jgi:hypothetical protein
LYWKTPMAISFASFRFPATKACSLLIIDADLCRRKLRHFEPIADKLIQTLDRDPTDPRISQALTRQAETRLSKTRLMISVHGKNMGKVTAVKRPRSLLRSIATGQRLESCR